MGRGNGEEDRILHSPVQRGVRGWLRVAWGGVREIGRDRMSLVAAGVGFYSFLAFFPAIAALVLIYGLVADVGDVAGQREPLRGVVPAVVVSLSIDPLPPLPETSDRRPGPGLLFRPTLARGRRRPRPTSPRPA